MAPEPKTIDLGVYRSEPAGDPAPEPGPVRWFPRYRGLVRRWSSAVLVVLLVASLTSAAGPDRPSLEKLWTIPDPGEDHSLVGRYDADEQHLYVVEPDRLTAYQLADGRVEWESRLPVTDPYVGLFLVAGLPTVTTNTSISEYVAYDPDTGQQRWRSRGFLKTAAHAWPILMTATDRADRVTTTVIDPATGRLTGSLRLTVPKEHPFEYGSVAGWRAPDGSRNLIVLHRDGRLARYDLATGTTVASVRTPHVESPDGSTNSLRIIEGTAVVGDQAADPPMVAAYDLVTLAPRWTMRRFWWPSQCGTAVCLERAGGDPAGSIRVVDPATGETRWSRTCSADTTRNAPCSLHVVDLTGHRLWVEEQRSPDGSEARFPETTAWIVEASTGDPLTGATSWSLDRRTADSSLILEFHEQAAPDQERPYRTWWAQSDADLSGPVLLGVEAAECDARSYPYLLCLTEEEELAVWRINA